MAEPYLEQLSLMVERLALPQTNKVTLESKHFFSGAALYADGNICALLSSMGLALKLPAETRQCLIQEQKGGEFRFFAEGPVKHEYVTLSELILDNDKALEGLIGQSVDHVLRRPFSAVSTENG